MRACVCVCMRMLYLIVQNHAALGFTRAVNPILTYVCGVCKTELSARAELLQLLTQAETSHAPALYHDHPTWDECLFYYLLVIQQQFLYIATNGGPAVIVPRVIPHDPLNCAVNQVLCDYGRTRHMYL